MKKINLKGISEILSEKELKSVMGFPMFKWSQRLYMRKTFFIIVLVSIMIGTFQAEAENKVIFTLHDNPNASYLLSIGEPLDGAYNNKVATFKQTIIDSDSIVFTYKKQYPAIIHVDVAERKFDVIMSQNTTTSIEIYPQISTDDWIVFHGDNAAGQKLYNDKPMVNFFMEIQKIFDDNSKNYHLIYSQIENYTDLTINQIDSLKKLSDISSLFAETLKSNWYVMICSFATMNYNHFIFSGKDFGFSTSDSIALQNDERKIFNIFSPLSTDILAYGVSAVSYIDWYIEAAYHTIDSTDNRYLPVFTEVYGKYGLLPDNIQKPMLGNAIIYQYVYNLNDYDKEKATAYFREKYPDSEYLPIIDKMAERYKQSQTDLLKEKTKVDMKAITEKDLMSKGEKSNTLPYDGAIHIDTTNVPANINTLKELHDTYFTGKKVFIDLWATWCKPCIKEFEYKENLDSLLSLNDIIPVLLSIDHPSFKKQWIRLVCDNKLNGYNFLINENLTEDIRRIANYADPMKGMPIPHFIFIDEQGNIIEKDAPRPSEIDKLAEFFRKNIREQ